jgi:LacI family transcriptional regulator
MKVTLRDVAETANVHFGTASCVLNGARGSTRVSPATRQRILESAQKLGYVPNRIAQQLRTRKSKVIGLLVGGLENLFFARMVSVCSEELERRGYDVILVMRRADQPEDLHLLEALISRQIDGMLVWSETNTEIRERLRWGDMTTTVLMGYPLEYRDSFAADAPEGVRMALDHLLGVGCRRIGYFAPEVGLHRTGDERYVTYKQWVAEHNLPELVYSFDGPTYNLRVSRERAEQLATEPDRPDGLFCMNDMVAMGAMSGLMRKGIRIPHDMAVVGFDDLPMSAELEIPLTSVHFPIQEICMRAIDVLLQRINESQSNIDHGALFNERVKMKLQVRDSSMK